MELNFPSIMAAGFDFLGIVIFLLIAFASQFTKRMKQKEEEAEKEIQRPPQAKPQPSHRDLLKELKTFMEEKSKPSPPPLPSKPPIQPGNRAHSRTIKPSVRRTTPAILQPEVAQTTPQIIRVENFPTREIKNNPAPEDFYQPSPSVAVEEPVRNSPSNRIDLKTVSALRKAFIYSEIFGKPRGLSPYS